VSGNVRRRCVVNEHDRCVYNDRDLAACTAASRPTVTYLSVHNALRRGRLITACTTAAVLLMMHIHRS